MDPVVILQETVFNLQACAHESVKTEDVPDYLPPSGTRAGWTLCETADPAPEVPCDDDPQRRHIMFEC